MHSAAIIIVEGRATIEVSALRPTSASATASRKMLIAAEPSRLLIPRAGLPIAAEVIVLASSGSEVIPPNSNMPTNA